MQTTIFRIHPHAKIHVNNTRPRRAIKGMFPCAHTQPQKPSQTVRSPLKNKHIPTHTGNEWVCRVCKHRTLILMCITIGLSPIPVVCSRSCVYVCRKFRSDGKKGQRRYNSRNSNNNNSGQKRNHTTQLILRHCRRDICAAKEKSPRR